MKFPQESRELVGPQRHHRGLVRRDGGAGQHHQPLRRRQDGGHPRRARPLPQARLEQVRLKLFTFKFVQFVYFPSFIYFLSLSLIQLQRVASVRAARFCHVFQ